MRETLATKIIVEVEREKKVLPPNTQAYRLILSILKHTKLKNLRRVQTKLTLLLHSDAIKHRSVKVFVDFVRYHTKSGKLRKRSYRTIIAKAKIALDRLSPLVDSEKVKSKPVDVVKSLRRIEALPETAIAPKKEIREDSVKRRQPRSTKNDDAVFLRSVRKSDVESLNPDEHGIITRSVVFLSTMIPQTILRTITVEYGIQKIAHYMVASHAMLLGVPASRDGQILSNDEKAQHASQILNLRNRINAKRGLEKMSMFGKPVNTTDHTYWLLLPTRVVNDANVRVGKWDFSERPKSVNATAKLVD
jgi:hypothetical protein